MDFKLDLYKLRFYLNSVYYENSPEEKKEAFI